MSLAVISGLYIKAVTMLPIVCVQGVKVLAEDVVGCFVSVSGVRVLRHIAKSIVT